jgi:Leucine-rich repeat (LRR) protein
MPEDETIAGFQNLQMLSISSCSLSGKIPLWLSKLKKLQVLHLRTNRLSGSIPAWIKSLESLTNLDISDNRFTGDPSSLSGYENAKNKHGCNPCRYRFI